MTVTYNFSCMDCGTWGGEDGYPGYMVRHILWNIAVRPHERRGHLCMPCFRKRLGRTMYLEDFISCALNQYNMPEILEFLGGKKNKWKSEKGSALKERRLQKSS